MKKLTPIILAIAMAASLTACSTTENDPQNNPDTSTDNKIVQVDQNSKPEEAPGESKDNNEDKDSSTDNKNDGSTPEGNTNGENNSNDKTDDKTDNKSEDNNENKDDNKTDNNTDNKTEDTAPPAEDNQTVALPLKEYPAGSYFTYDGKPCTDHSGCTWTTECNCVNFDLSIQSPGFAKYVYYKVTGKHVSLKDKTEMDIDLTAETAKSSLMGVPAGTYVAVQTNGDHFHAFIITGTSENGISVYQANYGGGCVVSAVTYSWADFAYRFPHLNYYVK